MFIIVKFKKILFLEVSRVVVETRCKSSDNSKDMQVLSRYIFQMCNFRNCGLHFAAITQSGCRRLQTGVPALLLDVRLLCC
jgi:hypothetical protein